MPEKHFLRQMQALPLSAKVLKSKLRIKEWYDYFNGDVCISFSGGKDSTVLASLVHDMYPDVPMVFCNTGLEYPEIQAFAKKMGAEFVRPKMSFSEVISTYGYPIISKENAEAIYYARRIRNSEGGGEIQAHSRAKTTTAWKESIHQRQALNGQRMYNGGGVHDTPQTLRINGLQSSARGGYQQESVRRNLIMGHQWNAIKQIGENGEEIPLPG